MRLFGVLLGEGNSKVGEVLNFSVPSVVTCPGASPWCLKYCYARRYEKLRPACRVAYRRNWELAQDIELFTETMLGVIPRIAPCFRIHVSGDFAEKEYIEAWYRVCQGYPKTRFWSYSRSWAHSGLLAPLERLRSLPNVQLLASTDPTMPLPPAGWRVAFVDTDSRAGGMLCQEQMGGEDSCLACGYCFKQDEGDVVFRVH